MEVRTCTVCGQRIPKGRLDAMPDTDTCAEHSQVVAYTEDDVELDTSSAEDMQRVFTPDRSI